MAQRLTVTALVLCSISVLENEIFSFLRCCDKKYVENGASFNKIPSD